MSVKRARSLLLLILAVVASSGCDRVGNAWQALTESDQAPADASGATSAPLNAAKDVDAAAESSPPVQGNQKDEPPFSVETQLDSYSRPVIYYIKATVNSLTINDIQINRGNCKLHATKQIEVPFAELKPSDVPFIKLAIKFSGANEPMLLYWPYGEKPPENNDDWHDGQWMAAREEELKQKGQSAAYAMGHGNGEIIDTLETREFKFTIDDIPSDISKFQVIRSEFPVTLKFAENYRVISLCNFDDIIELKIDTDVGSWTWTR